MHRGVLLASLGLWCGLSSAGVLAQEEPRDLLHDASARPEAHAHENDIAVLLAVTYENEANENLFTVGGEYTRRVGSRVRVAAVGEHLSGPGAWVFVFPVALRPWEGLWLSAGPGFEAKSRRSLLEEEARHSGASQGHGENEMAPDDLRGSEKFLLVRAGAYYIFKIGSRYTLKTGAAIDWVDIGSGTATALVYGVAFGVGF